MIAKWSFFPNTISYTYNVLSFSPFSLPTSPPPPLLPSPLLPGRSAICGDAAPALPLARGRSSSLHLRSPLSPGPAGQGAAEHGKPARHRPVQVSSSCPPPPLSSDLAVPPAVRAVRAVALCRYCSSPTCHMPIASLHDTVIWLYLIHVENISCVIISYSFNFVHSPYRIRNTCENVVVEKYSHV